MHHQLLKKSVCFWHNDYVISLESLDIMFGLSFFWIINNRKYPWILYVTQTTFFFDEHLSFTCALVASSLFYLPFTFISHISVPFSLLIINLSNNNLLLRILCLSFRCLYLNIFSLEYILRGIDNTCIKIKDLVLWRCQPDVNNTTQVFRHSLINIYFTSFVTKNKTQMQSPSFP